MDLDRKGVLYRFDPMSNAHNELVLLSHFGDKLIWRLTRIKRRAEHFRRSIKRSSKAISLNVKVLKEVRMHAQLSQWVICH